MSLAKVWGDRLETHVELGWEEREESQAQQVNKLFRALLAEETGAGPPPLKATTAQGSLSFLVFTSTGCSFKSSFFLSP
ncbi:MAG TPA: hypothetical protein GXX33_07995 [Firmicutes bacterium]|uniref:Uncharacterized protein n=1 Tax=Capillibacterium thermochitinicola TaxID=2699427 RepID=A0A8J6LLM0_9FIRM|nr:hypothetical protein [Capillibacterium thermochitinicola]MBA2132258.1 hypothetical protein [Capillibacterium thermochitinicola]HHW12925.1 hypothetical protein [Bacillota bacterium]